MRTYVDHIELVCHDVVFSYIELCFMCYFDA